MKFVYVVDCITDLTNKVNTIKNKFGEEIYFVVKADLVELFKTFGFVPNAIYYKNLSEVVHSLLARTDLDDVIICYASLKFDNKLLTHFTNSIGNKSKVVCLMPNYNFFERMCNSAYNVYVKSLFKAKDSMASPKLQFIPAGYLYELLSSHIGNKMFELNPEYCHNVYVEDKEINKSMKVKSHSIKFDIISLIVALVVTIGLIASIAYYKPSYLIILACIILYVLDIIITLILQFKSKFDNRFLK